MADDSISRRNVLRLGGMSVAMAAVIAACGNTEAGEPGRVGSVPPTTGLPDVSVTDVTLLRTCSSLQHSLIGIFAKVLADPTLLDPANKPLIERLNADAEATAKIFEDLTVANGGEAWACGNTKFDAVLVDTAITRITVGAEATAEAKAIPPSDDPRRDILNLVYGVETIIGAAYQQYTGMFNDASLRRPTIEAGVRGCRHSALVALTINPGGYVSESGEDAAEVTPSTDAATTTTTQNIGNTTTTAAADSSAPQVTPIPDVYALTSTFGTTATVTLIVGDGDENGTRLKVLLETPSLNSMEYEYLGACP